jgi:hypothetical protein
MMIMPSVLYVYSYIVIIVVFLFLSSGVATTVQYTDTLPVETRSGDNS